MSGVHAHGTCSLERSCFTVCGSRSSSFGRRAAVPENSLRTNVRRNIRKIKWLACCTEKVRSSGAGRSLGRCRAGMSVGAPRGRSGKQRAAPGRQRSGERCRCPDRRNRRNVREGGSPRQDRPIRFRGRCLCSCARRCRCTAGRGSGRGGRTGFRTALPCRRAGRRRNDRRP